MASKMMPHMSRIVDDSKLDFFPTPPFATRALYEYPLKGVIKSSDVVYEPCAGIGAMADVIKEYNDKVITSDIKDYGYKLDHNKDFLTEGFDVKCDWIITNPPYNLATEFILKSLDSADKGVAMLLRTQFIETKGRYEKLFSNKPFSIMAQFVERVGMKYAVVDEKAASATPYAWFIWIKGETQPKVMWIPPIKNELSNAALNK